MAATGPQWSLYPLLAIIAFCTFSLSGLHIFFCLPFHILFAPLLAGIVALLTAFHAIFLRYPNRTDFVLQVIAALFSSAFFFSSALETFCLSKNKDDSSSSGDICEGVTYRTESLVGSCNGFFGNMQAVVMRNANWELHSARIFVSSCLTALAASQLLITTALSFYSAHETKLRIRTFHYQFVLGLLLIVSALFHWQFCCLYYFVSLPAACGLLCLAQGLTTRLRPSSLSRALDVAGTFASIALFSSLLFSILCTVSSIFDWRLSILRHCRWGDTMMKGCRRSLHFSYPYFNWQLPQIEHEVTTIQIAIYTVLLIFSLLYFYFSMKSTFRLRKKKERNIYFD
ncbi:hypothetical protein PENTCL1PPCAC_78 [Pristionchus entomophagus]|uniref:G protein-coupled receptor n=1 Tax=Pristionchus entomophagus TaxID=358040 RepID=A0AAV5S7Y2_9BILA|nr:hypothetical protein PENTCL1PPCAC_78 [Pristionchus entomophagus]